MHQLTLRTIVRPSLRHLQHTTSAVPRLAFSSTPKTLTLSSSSAPTRHVPGVNRLLSTTVSRPNSPRSSSSSPPPSSSSSSSSSSSHPHMNNPGKPGSGPSANMNLKNVSVGLVASSLVLGGAVWYSQRGGAGDDAVLSSAVESPTMDTAPPPTAIAPDHDATTTTTTTSTTTALVHGPREPAMQKVVAVDEESLYTATLPIEKKIEDSGGKKVLAMLSPDEATAKLRANEESYNVGRGTGVWRYDVVQIPSNNPIEDDHAEKIIEVPAAVAPPYEGKDTSDWMFWGVFDGHSGWTTSAKLRQVLIGFVARELNETYKAAAANKIPEPSPEAIDLAIKKGFVRLDNEIVHASVEKVFKNPSKIVAAEALAPALSGSCAMLAFYESRSRNLRVACTGDSRAVLGRRLPNGNWTATALSDDQTGSTPSEAARLRAEHPGEPNVVRHGRVLGGLEPTRAFGDAFYKWSRETQERIKRQFFGRTPSPMLQTPPYVTAEPVVTTTKIQPENGDFVVLATDGLWEMLTNEEVVGLVARWIDEQNVSPPGTADGRPATGNKGWFGGWFSKVGANGGQVLPIDKIPPTAGGSNMKDENGAKTPIRMLQWGVTASDAERFVFQDRNAATHLVRNALGGKDSDMLCALLTLQSPYSRRYRDDLTVEVIFFGKTPETTGTITVNEEATADRGNTVVEEVKAKL